jgi:hypothetical protein
MRKTTRARSIPKSARVLFGCIEVGPYAVQVWPCIA